MYMYIAVTQWLPMHFFLQYVSILIYHQFLLINIVTKKNHVLHALPHALLKMVCHDRGK